MTYLSMPTLEKGDDRETTHLEGCAVVLETVSQLAMCFLLYCALVVF